MTARWRYTGGTDSHKRRQLVAERSPKATPTLLRVARSSASQIQISCRLLPTHDHTASISTTGRGGGDCGGSTVIRSFFEPLNNRGAAEAGNPSNSPLRNSFSMQLRDHLTLLLPLRFLRVKRAVAPTLLTVIFLLPARRSTILDKIGTCTLWTSHGNHQATPRLV